jgi:hypothetical protein
MVTFRSKIAEIQQIIAEGQEDNVFVNDSDGIWFGGVNKTNTGWILVAKQVDKSSMECTKHISRIMNSPPKKQSSIQLLGHPSETHRLKISLQI